MSASSLSLSALSSSSSSSSSMDVSDHQSSAVSSTQQVLPSLTMTMIGADYANDGARYGTKRGLSCFTAPDETVEPMAAAQATSPGRRKMSRVAVWTGTPWGSNRHASAVSHSSTPSSPPPPPPPPRAPSLPPPPRATPHQPAALVASDVNSQAFGRTVQRPAELTVNDFATGRTAGVQAKWAAAAAAAGNGRRIAGGAGAVGRAVLKSAEPCAEEATAPSWGTGGGVGSFGGFGGDSAPSRGVEPASDGMEVVFDSDERSAAVVANVVEDVGVVARQASGVDGMLDVSVSGSGAAGDRVNTVGTGGEWGSGGPTVAAVTWASELARRTLGADGVGGGATASAAENDRKRYFG